MRFQFRLRTLFAITTIVSVQCAVCFPILKDWERFDRVRQILATMGNAQNHDRVSVVFPSDMPPRRNGVRRVPVGALAPIFQK
jgi:hypothetical protein